MYVIVIIYVLPVFGEIIITQRSLAVTQVRDLQ